MGFNSNEVRFQTLSNTILWLRCWACHWVEARGHAGLHWCSPRVGWPTHWSWVWSRVGMIHWGFVAATVAGPDHFPWIRSWSSQTADLAGPTAASLLSLWRDWITCQFLVVGKGLSDGFLLSQSLTKESRVLLCICLFILSVLSGGVGLKALWSLL